MALGQRGWIKASEQKNMSHTQTRKHKGFELLSTNHGSWKTVDQTLKILWGIISNLESQTQPNCYSKMRADWKHSMECPHSLIIHPSSEAPWSRPWHPPRFHSRGKGRHPSVWWRQGEHRWRRGPGEKSTWPERAAWAAPPEAALSRCRGHAWP